jgi:preprotein translocase subunit SecD
MQNRYVPWLIVIAVLLVVAGWFAWPTNTQINIPLGAASIQRDISVREGLDLKGGLQVLLEADNCAAATADGMTSTKTVVENRVNGLGVAEPLVQISGSCRIVVELPGLSNSEQALSLLKQTGLLEFVDTGSNSLQQGTVIQTDVAQTAPASSTTTTPGAGTSPATSVSTSAATSAATVAATTGAGTAAPTAAPTTAATEAAVGPIYHTIMTGADLSSASVDTSQSGIVVRFNLTDKGKNIFGQYTTANVGRFLTIVLDKHVLSSPRINSAITGGNGIIEGNFTQAEANNLALNLRYGSLPVSLHIAESRTVGATLGEDSVRKSIIAGAIGLAAVAIFMILYYRLPGVLAVLALLLYATLTFALFKLIPVTLTLPGIAGFILSVGVAVDANILIFERMKEELRSGKKLNSAVDEGFRRAWTSIRDSNISTLITCGILYWFGSQFGASIVKGFAFTLALGVAVSLFTAIIVTRTLLHVVLDNIDFSERHSLFGI